MECSDSLGTNAFAECGAPEGGFLLGEEGGERCEVRCAYCFLDFVAWLTVDFFEDLFAGEGGRLGGF